MKNKIFQLWKRIYPDQDETLLESFLRETEKYKQTARVRKEDWYKDALIYALYVDLFNFSFQGLIKKLDYLQALGINTLWLLPILDSPMRDAGFDIKDYRNIRSDLLEHERSVYTSLSPAEMILTKLRPGRDISVSRVELFYFSCA